ncbi:MAG: TRAM domain-containing protein, partial [Halobacteriales archaeon]
MFTAEVQSRDGTPLITVPDRELAIGELEVGETYRVAVLPRHGAGSDGAGGSGTASSSRSRDGAPPVEEGETLDVEIEDVGDQGDGIARI